MSSFETLPHCPDCGVRLSVDDTAHVRGNTYRKLSCKCGQRFESEEKITRRLPPVAISRNRRRPVPTEDDGPQPVATDPPASAGGVGGGVSSGQDPRNPDPNPISLGNPDQTRARNKRGANIEYPPEFEAAWDATDKTGSKFEAFTVWQRVGRPVAEVIAPAWRKWKATPKWQEGYVWDVRRWLRGRCWEQEPSSTPLPKPVQKKAPLPFAVAEEQARQQRIQDQKLHRLEGELGARRDRPSPRQEYIAELAEGKAVG